MAGYTLQIRDKAAFEFREAFQWYNNQRTGLGEEFETSVNDKLNRIKHNPNQYKKAYKNYHEALTERFPFLIAYQVNEDKKMIIIVAIFHTSRNPKQKYRK